ncbi:N-acetylglucosamine-6-phosphate deacetylase [Mycetocola spongiae]|uniref:N-acetylglucosamine-6-phosphate deacetylase n=1 Tax=Mycetocola spongiae TaxID=2859226 RepID=UPI001CF42692|nr:amidohydrolase family protein [Mycetocola spongiae]
MDAGRLLRGAQDARGNPLWLRIRAGKIAARGAGEPPAPEPGEILEDLAGLRLLPGLIDVHCHGGGGFAMNAGSPEAVVAAARAHLAHGTTALLASVGSGPAERMLAAARAIAAAIDSGRAPTVLGIHFEGPFLSAERAGAHSPEVLRAPDPAFLAELLAASGGYARSMTIAPELPGATELISLFADRLLFSAGHTAVDAGGFRDSVGAGVSGMTHVFNAMPALGHRDPGPIPVALVDDRMSIEVIADGHHLAPEIIDLVIAAAGARRVMLITDASAVAGLGDGEFDLIDRRVSVRNGAVTLRGSATLAGSSLTLDLALARLRGRGYDFPDLAELGSGTAARFLGEEARGHLEVGARADIIALTEAAGVGVVYLAGEPVLGIIPAETGHSINRRGSSRGGGA